MSQAVRELLRDVEQIHVPASFTFSTNLAHNRSEWDCREQGHLPLPGIKSRLSSH